MKKLGLVLLSILVLMFLAACITDDDTDDVIGTQEILHTSSQSNIPPLNNTPTCQDSISATTEPPSSSSIEVDDYSHISELCECGQHYTDELLRFPTPPINAHEILSPQLESDTEYNAVIADFVRDFENIYTITHNEYPFDWYTDALILWSDAPLRDFSFVVIDFWEGNSVEEGWTIRTTKIPFTIDELLPTDVVVINVAFSHYLRPHAAVIFADETGLQTRMFIEQSMEDRCYPAYYLWPVDEDRVAVWN
jgi:hypothetical protein